MCIPHTGLYIILSDSGLKWIRLYSFATALKPQFKAWWEVCGTKHILYLCCRAGKSFCKLFCSDTFIFKNICFNVVLSQVVSPSTSFASHRYTLFLLLYLSNTHAYTHTLTHMHIPYREFPAYGLFNVTATRRDCIDFPHGWCLLTWSINPHLHTHPAPLGNCSLCKVKHTPNCLLKRDRRRRLRGGERINELRLKPSLGIREGLMRDSYDIDFINKQRWPSILMLFCISITAQKHNLQTSASPQ